MGGGSKKVCAQKYLNEGQIGFPGRPAPLAVGRPRIEPPTHRSVVGCITIRPLFALAVIALPTACSPVYH